MGTRVQTKGCFRWLYGLVFLEGAGVADSGQGLLQLRCCFAFTQLVEVQLNGNPSLLVLGPTEGVQGLGQGASPQVSTESRESQVGI